jgi:F0F1-type ATP synthase assembly protein I
MLISSVKSLYSARSRLPVGSPEINFISAIEVGFYGYAATGFFLSQGYATLLFLLVGLSVVVTNLTKKTSSGTGNTALMSPNGNLGVCR